MAQLKSGTRIYGTATIDTSVVVGSAVTLSSSGIRVSGVTTTAILNVGTGGTVIATTGIGSIGIGTTNPAEKLQVQGNVKVTSSTSATQDGIILSGRAGGTTSLAVTITPTTLTASRTLTLPDTAGTVVTTGDSATVTNTMLSTVSTSTIRGRVTAGTGAVENLTGTQATTLLDTFTSALKGLAPASGGGTSNFLRADGTWAAAGGSTISNSPSGTLFPTMSSTTSGSFATAVISSSTLTFTASTGTLSATQFTSLSDANKKKNIRPIENAIDITKKLEGVRFDWKDTNSPSIGVIAQEVEKVLPELVVNTDGVKSVSYGNIVGLLIEAIKEQQVRIEELERKLNA